MEEKIAGIKSSESLLKPKNGYVVILVFVLASLLLPMQAYSRITHLYNIGSSENQERDINSSKFVILNFDDTNIDQIRYAKPILDKYGFKATFFPACGLIGPRLWESIKDLQEDGMDVQSHSLTHPDLNTVSVEQLENEIVQSKQCLLSHGFNPTIFAYPYGNGWNNRTVVKTVADYYDFARTDSKDPLTFLNCDSWNNISFSVRADDSFSSMASCIENGSGSRYSSKSGSGDHRIDLHQTLGSSRYSINSWSHRHIEGLYDYSKLTCIDNCQYYNNSQLFDRFINAVNSQDSYNKDGIIRAIPIIVYHAFVPYSNIEENKIPTDTSIDLFESEMKYLHDNGFKVLTMAELLPNESNNTQYVNVPL